MSFRQMIATLTQHKDCPACAEKEKRIAYLEKLVDNLLLKHGVVPVVKEPLKMDDLEGEEKVPEGAVRFGS